MGHSLRVLGYGYWVMGTGSMGTMGTESGVALTTDVVTHNS